MKWIKFYPNHLTAELVIMDSFRSHEVSESAKFKDNENICSQVIVLCYSLWDKIQKNWMVPVVIAHAGRRGLEENTW